VKRKHQHPPRFTRPFIHRFANIDIWCFRKLSGAQGGDEEGTTGAKRISFIRDSFFLGRVLGKDGGKITFAISIDCDSRITKSVVYHSEALLKNYTPSPPPFATMNIAMGGATNNNINRRTTNWEGIMNGLLPEANHVLPLVSHMLNDSTEVFLLSTTDPFATIDQRTWDPRLIGLAHRPRGLFHVPREDPVFKH